MENKSKNRLAKGSQEAKDAMANLRSKRGGANKPPVETTTPPPTQPIEIPTQPKAKSRKKLNVDIP